MAQNAYQEGEMLGRIVAYFFVSLFWGAVAGFFAWALWSLWVAIKFAEGASLPVGVSVGGVVFICLFIVLNLISYGFEPEKGG